MKSLLAKVLSVVSIVVFSGTALASGDMKVDSSTHFKGFVKISADRELFVDWNYAKIGKPTIVLLNGLTYSTVDWEKFTQALIKKGIGVFRYDPMGMGQTLLKYAPVLNQIKIEDQAKDLSLLLAKTAIPKPYNLVGLSYGGGLAFAYAEKYKEDIGNLIAMSPFTEPIAAQDQWIKSQVWYTRQMQPWNVYSDDDLYDYFLKQIVYTTYPSAEPTVLDNPYKLEAVFRMAQGIRHFLSSSSYLLLPPHSFHLMIAGKDQYIPRDDLEKFWNLSVVQSRASKIIVKNSEHKIPEAVPGFAASWVQLIVEQSPLLNQSVTFEGDPSNGEITFKGGKFNVGNP